VAPEKAEESECEREWTAKEGEKGKRFKKEERGE
jgi:hypothetical protein